MILVTGHAGFIGYHLVKKLLFLGHEVVGLDNLNDYYDVSLKRSRLARLEGLAADIRMDLEDGEGVKRVFAQFRPEVVIHLAAQAGVRYSLAHPDQVMRANVMGMLHVLEACRAYPPKHLLFASSSSVYGDQGGLPYRVTDRTDAPVSPYAASKKAGEVMAHTYAHLYGIPSTGLRFFTVYGPMGRPDMAPHLFATAMMAHRPIALFNHGKMARDFTYVDDVVESVVRLLEHPPSLLGNKVPFSLYNVGRGEPVSLLTFVQLLEEALGQKAQITFYPMQPGDVKKTWAEVERLRKTIDFVPEVSLAEGISRFASWFLEYYHG